MFGIFNKTHYTFEGQQEGEKVILFIHRHILVLFFQLTGIIILSILPLIIYPLVKSILADYANSYIVSLCFAGFYLIMWSAFIHTVTMYLLDYWIVTDRRILSNTQHGFFNRRVSEMQFSRVQDISVNIQGIIHTLFHFGEVNVQSAGTGTVSNFIFRNVPAPHQIKDTIMSLVEHRNINA